MKLQFRVLVFLFLAQSAVGLADHLIPLPSVPTQTDRWSCGLNSAARVLRYYGSGISLEKLMKSCPKAIEEPFFVAGGGPQQLADCVNELLHSENSSVYGQYSFVMGDQIPSAPVQSASVQVGASLDTVLESLSKNHPVIVLLKPRIHRGKIEKALLWALAKNRGFKDVNELMRSTEFAKTHGLTKEFDERNETQFEIPSFHYVVLHGYGFSNPEARTGLYFYFLESLDGKTHKLPVEVLEKKWNWAPETGFLKKAVDVLGIKPRTMVTIQPPEWLQSSDSKRTGKWFPRLFPKL